jgi:hypothetical protein
MKALTVIAVGSALLLTGKYLFSLNKAQDKIIIVVSGKVYKISAQGVTLIIKYNIKNPTRSTMRMTAPLITLTVNGKQVATSNMQLIDIPEASKDLSGKIVIRPNNETGDIQTEVMIPWIGLANIAPDLIARFQHPDENAKKITVKVGTNSVVYTLVGSFPYEQTSIIKV